MRISHKFKKRLLRTRVIRKIEQVPIEDFNKIFPHVPENYFFLKTLDESGFDQFSFYYIVVYANKQLVGFAPCFTVNYSKIFFGLFSVKALCCGIPMGQGQVGISQSYSGILEAIQQRMEALARKVHASIIAFKDFDQSYDDLLKPLLKDEFLKINGLPMTRLDLGFTNFEDYLKTLSGATRYDFRRKIKESLAVTIESNLKKTLDEETLNEVYSLYLQNVESHHTNSEIVPKEFFRLISKNMPQEAKFFLFRINGKLAAFTFCLVSKSVLIDYYLGLDYTLAHEFHLYFIKFKEITNWCLAHGIKTYEMGATGYEPKRRLNFDLIPVYLYVKGRHKILRPFLKCLCFLLKFKKTII